MATKEKKELFRKLNECRAEINKLKTTLNEIDEQKENWFSKKEKYSDEIGALISKVKENKNKRDSLTKGVKNDKGQREKFNEEIKKKISQVRELNKKKQEFLKKHNIKEDPSMIKGEIEKLEFRIETDVMPFDREKELMKRIKELKKKYEQSKEIRDICEKTFDVSKEIDNLKGDAKEVHKRIQSRAKESQIKHEEMIKVSGNIDELKIKEKNAFEKFMEFKKKFNEANEQLKNKLPEMGKLKEEADKYNLELKKKKKEKEEKFLKSKEDVVKEKMKKGKKLTTEDLLIFQNQKE